MIERHSILKTQIIPSNYFSDSPKKKLEKFVGNRREGMLSVSCNVTRASLTLSHDERGKHTSKCSTIVNILRCTFKSFVRELFLIFASRNHKEILRRIYIRGNSVEEKKIRFNV